MNDTKMRIRGRNLFAWSIVGGVIGLFFGHAIIGAVVVFVVYCLLDTE